MVNLGVCLESQRVAIGSAYSVMGLTKVLKIMRRIPGDHSLAFEWMALSRFSAFEKDLVMCSGQSIPWATCGTPRYLYLDTFGISCKPRKRE